LLGHWGAMAKSTWNYLQKEPLQWVLKVAFRYSVATRGIEILEKRGVWGNAKLTFTQHTKTAKGCNCVRMQVDQFAPQIIQDSYQKFKCNSKQTILVRSIVGNSKVVGVQRRPPGSHTASWKLAISFSSTIGSFQYSNRFEICFFTMA
jgi:hypothetical protein